MPNKKFPVTELDFDQIKTGLREYLKSQEQFKDYDFEGSNLSVMLDILSYNTFQNAFYTNMAVSEMFLDSAQIKNSVVSHAKELNYLPQSKSSARALIDVSFNVNDNPSFIIIPEKTKFTAKCGDRSYTFSNDRSVTVFPTIVDGVRKYIFRGLPVYEGTYITERFTVSEDFQKYTLLNSDLDLNSIRVFVDDSDETREYVFAPDLYGLNPDSRVFFIEPYLDNQYQIFFGNDRFGIEPNINSIIRIEYRITAGDKANGITSFTAPNDISGYPTTVLLRSASRGGSEEESLESIRYFAPKSIQIQERAITERDFEVLLKRRFPEIRSVAVYGGEKMIPPQYGRVFVSIDLVDTTPISVESRNRYRTFLKERCGVNIEPFIRNAKYVYYEVTANVEFDSVRYNKSEGVIRQAVRQSILDFSEKNLQQFKKPLKKSRLSESIINSDESILSTNLYLRSVLDIIPESINRIPNSVINLGKRILIHPPRSNPTIREGIETYPIGVISTTFIFRGKSSFLRDDGRGTINIVTRDSNRVETLVFNAGTVDYDLGIINIDSFRIDDFVGDKIKLYVTGLNQDIPAVLDRIGIIRDEDIRIRVTPVE